MSAAGNMPVYPCQPVDGSGNPICAPWDGITLRQHYAGLAMQGCIQTCASDTLIGGEAHAQMFARKAVACADALLAELAK